MLYFSAVSPEALELLREIQDLPVLHDFYLVRGTSLALRYGHRISVDLDFFTGNEFETGSLIDTLNEKYPVHVLSQAKNSITLEIHTIKTDFIRHNYPLLNLIGKTDEIRMASIEDVAAMKLNSTVNRGSKKDFFDIYELLNHFKLHELIKFYTTKYDFNSQMILLKSLAYFDDAEQEPDPVSINPTSWDSVKQKILLAVRLYSEG